MSQDTQIGTLDSIAPSGLTVSVWHNADGTVQVNVYREDLYERSPVSLYVDGDEVFNTSDKS